MIDPGYIRKRLARTGDAVRTFSRKGAVDLAKACELVVDTYRDRGKVLIFGNGGSASMAQHIAAELVNRMLMDRDPLAAIALTTDTSIITSVANDYDFDTVFEKQVRALGRPNDLAWGLSTSGTSANVIRALEAAGEIKMKRLAMAGPPGTRMEDLSDLCLCVEADGAAVIQEVHLAAAHVICELVEVELFGDGG